MTEQNAPLAPGVYEDIEPDPTTQGEVYEPCAPLELDTDEAPYFDPSQGAGGPDRYRYGKVPATILTVTSETVERPYVCCGYSSAQMAARTAKAGVSADLKHEGHAVRSRSGRPHNAGSNPTELRNGLRAALGVDVDSIAKSAVPGRLRGGYAVVAALDYGPLPEYLKVQGGNFGHSVCLFGWREDGNYAGYFDPLWPQGAQGAWAKWSDIDQALWSSGHNTTKPKYVPPVQPTVHLISGATAHRHTYTVRGDNTNVRTQPKIADNVHHQLDAGAHFAAYQRTSRGGTVSGSRVWYGDATGTRWLHSSVVR
jgi:hypothetical protein